MSDRLNLRNYLTALLLFVGLQGAQFALFGHGIEHVFHEHEAVCLQCLSLPGMLALPKQAASLPVLHLPVITGASTIPAAPALAFHPAFRSRAPPSLHG